MIPTSFLDRLLELKMPNVFNPYVDICSDYDLPNAPAIRRNNLEQVLTRALDKRVDIIWIARDLGYRGGRRTGLALTDEAHLDDHANLYGDLDLQRATKGPIVWERTANTIWGLLKEIQRPVFLWNVFPFHPHELGDSASNRCHTTSEAAPCKFFIEALISSFQPKAIVTIGNEAHKALVEFKIPHIQARHPSYGGQKQFVATIRKSFCVTDVRDLAPSGQSELFE